MSVRVIVTTRSSNRGGGHRVHIFTYTSEKQREEFKIDLYFSIYFSRSGKEIDASQLSQRFFLILELLQSSIRLAARQSKMAVSPLLHQSHEGEPHLAFFFIFHSATITFERGSRLDRTVSPHYYCVQ